VLDLWLDLGFYEGFRSFRQYETERVRLQTIDRIDRRRRMAGEREH
jgi:hypothetical protein